MAAEPHPFSSPAVMRPQLQKYTTALSSFSSSPSTFSILTSFPLSTLPSTPPSTLYVLDSSFNPPTRAHLRLATSALLHDHGGPPKRLLLLLATQNADKAPKPAAFDERLMMMELFARDLLESLSSSATLGSAQGQEKGQPQCDSGTTVDIAITKNPYFNDKAASISASGSYPSTTTQVHLTGFDTLIRILDPKYYPPAHTLAPLAPFLSKHRLRVAYRESAEWGDVQEQDAYLSDLREGRREEEGGKREWAERIEMVGGREDEEVVVSSTIVRKVVEAGDEKQLRRLVTDRVASWILELGLYQGR